MDPKLGTFDDNDRPEPRTERNADYIKIKKNETMIKKRIDTTGERNADFKFEYVVGRVGQKVLRQIRNTSDTRSRPDPWSGLRTDLHSVPLRWSEKREKKKKISEGTRSVEVLSSDWTL